MTLNELNPILARLGGIRAAARLIKRDHRGLSRYSRGERAVPPDVAAQLRSADAMLSEKDAAAE
jgi:hypothetical protein